MSEEKSGALFTNFLDKIRKNKKLQLITISFFLVIILLIFMFGFKGEEKENPQNSDISSYVENLEKKLSFSLSKVEGAGAVSVVIKVESGMETVLAMNTVTKETSSGIETESSPIIINGKTVVVKEKYPKITGVLIVAEGAKNINIMTKLQQATMSLLDIKINQIEILSMN